MSAPQPGRPGRLPIYDSADTDRLPAYLFVPCPQVPDGASEFLIELRELSDGRNVLQAYSSPELLAAAYGSEQSWIRIPADGLEHVRTYSEFDAVLLDTSLPHTADGLPVDELVEPDPRLGTGLVYIPCRSQPEDPEDIEVALAEVESDGRALLVYTSKPMLAACCGLDQPWFAIPVERIPDLRRECGVDVMNVNVPIPLELRNGRAEGIIN